MNSRSRNLGLVIQGIHSAQKNLSTLINRIIDPIGLNMSQLTVLAYFSNRPNRSQTITSITAAVEMNQPAVTKIVSYLISEGWLSTEPNPGDARKRSLKISSEGLGLVIKAYGKLSPEIDQAFASLSDEQARQLQILLQQLNSS
jgi:DNA-binding MarR family transcriptional regulator